MEQNEHELDNALAKLTDDVLGGQDGAAENTPDVKVIRIMKELTEATPSQEFRARLTDALNREWDTMQHTKRRTTTQTQWYKRPSSRWVALAATLVVLIGLVAILGTTQQPGLPGATLGDPGVVIVIVGILIGAGVIAAVVMNRRGK
jgi:hypothetical protein